MLRSVLPICLAVLLSACNMTSTPAPVSEAQPLSDATACAEPRPQVCTMEYNPVCAELQSGGRGDYSSPCNACADVAVSGYLNGACADQG